MTQDSIVRERFARWVDGLFDHGYVVENASRAATAPGSGLVIVSAPRRELLGAPTVLIEIAEAWLSGPDPHGLGLEEHGCHLVAASWHAQITGEADTGAERLDVDRTKRDSLRIHSHPFGRPNDHRVPSSHAPAPEAWINHIEVLCAEDQLARGSGR